MLQYDWKLLLSDERFEVSILVFAYIGASVHTHLYAHSGNKYTSTSARVVIIYYIRSRSCLTRPLFLGFTL